MRHNGNRVRKQGKCFKSSGPEHTIRGQAVQIAQKYKELAEEAPDHDKQSLLQHAHHWQCVHQENRPQP